MKKATFILALCTLLSSCSLLERSPDVEPAADAEETDGNEVELEVAKLNTKIAALETKLDVLTTNMERMSAQRSQPIIEADTYQQAPQQNMAAPVDIAEDNNTPHSAIEPEPVETTPVSSSGAEKEFRSAMSLFQNSKYLEASSHFAMIAQTYPSHLLASHSLYWAGEASARAKQWSLAMENWEALERRYPRSAYLAEALSGLSKAYEQQGNMAKAKEYKNTLLRAFPKSPIAVNLPISSQQGQSLPQSIKQSPEERIPTYEEQESPAPMEDEE